MFYTFNGDGATIEIVIFINDSACGIGEIFIYEVDGVVAFSGRSDFEGNGEPGAVLTVVLQSTVIGQELGCIQTGVAVVSGTIVYTNCPTGPQTFLCNRNMIEGDFAVFFPCIVGRIFRSVTIFGNRSESSLVVCKFKTPCSNTCVACNVYCNVNILLAVFFINFTGNQVEGRTSLNGQSHFVGSESINSSLNSGGTCGYSSDNACSVGCDTGSTKGDFCISSNILGGAIIISTGYGNIGCTIDIQRSGIHSKSDRGQCCGDRIGNFNGNSISVNTIKACINGCITFGSSGDNTVSIVKFVRYNNSCISGNISGRTIRIVCSNSNISGIANGQFGIIDSKNNRFNDYGNFFNKNCNCIGGNIFISCGNSSITGSNCGDNTCFVSKFVGYNDSCICGYINSRTIGVVCSNGNVSSIANEQSSIINCNGNSRNSGNLRSCGSIQNECIGNNVVSGISHLVCSQLVHPATMFQTKPSIGVNTFTCISYRLEEGDGTFQRCAFHSLKLKCANFSHIICGGLDGGFTLNTENTEDNIFGFSGINRTGRMIFGNVCFVTGFNTQHGLCRGGTVVPLCISGDVLNIAVGSFRGAGLNLCRIKC